MPKISIQSNSTHLPDNKEATALKQEEIDIIQKKLQQNKVVFYGYPFLVILYSFAIVLFFIYPAVEKYFVVQKELDILEKNYENLQKTFTNLKDVKSLNGKLEYYENQLASLIPEESHLGSIIDEIQKKADSFSLERKVGPASINDDKNNIDRLNSLAENVNVDDLFETINSGEVRFKPKSIQSEESEAKLLSIDLAIKGKKNDFFAFMKSLESMRPLLNVTTVSYKESKSPSGDPDVEVNIRIESYTLKLNYSTANTTVTKFGENDRAVLNFIPEEKFELDSDLEKEFLEYESTPL